MQFGQEGRWGIVKTFIKRKTLTDGIWELQKQNLQHGNLQLHDTMFAEGLLQAFLPGKVGGFGADSAEQSLV